MFTSRVAPEAKSVTLVELEPLGRTARALFLEFAGLERASLTDTQSRAIDRIVDRLDGLPLSLELAAGRLDAMTLEELASRLDDVFAMVRAPTATPDDPHGGLWATLGFSWSLLEPWQRVGLAQLSCFRGTFGLRPAEAIVDLGPANSPVAPTAIDVIQAALKTHLLFRETTADGSGSVYRMLPTIREFASRHLDDESGAVWNRYVGALADIVVARPAADTLASHRADMLAVLDRPAATPELAASLGEVAIGLGDALYRTGEWTSATRVMETGAARLSEVEPLADDALRAELLRRRARLQRFCALIAEHRGHVREGLARAREAAALSDSIDDGRGSVVARLTQVGCALYLDDFDLAQSVLTELDRYLDHPEVTAQERGSKLAYESWLLSRDGRFDEALEREWAAIEVHRAAGIDGMVATALNGLAASAIEAERFDVARDALDQFAAVPGAFEDEARAAMHEALTYWLGFVNGTFDTDALLRIETRFQRMGAVHHVAVARAQRALALLARAPIPTAKAALEHARTALESPPTAPWSAIIDLALDTVVCLAEPTRDPAVTPEAPPHGLFANAARALGAIRDAVCGRATAADARFARDQLVSKGMREVVDRLSALAESNASRWRVASDGTWFQPPSADRVEVRSRAPRRLLAALARARAGEAPDGLTRDALFEVGWPGESASERAAANRVYVALSKLRRLGLADLVANVHGAYQLAPDRVVEITGARGEADD